MKLSSSEKDRVKQALPEITELDLGDYDMLEISIEDLFNEKWVKTNIEFYKLGAPMLLSIGQVNDEGYIKALEFFLKSDIDRSLLDKYCTEQDLYTLMDSLKKDKKG